MKKKNKEHFPPPKTKLINANVIDLLSNVKTLTVEDVVVMYAYSEAIVETVREPLIILDGNLRIKTANKAFFDTFEVNKDDTYDNYIFELGNGQWNIPSLKQLLKRTLATNQQFTDFEVTHTFENIGTRSMLLNARRIILEGHKTELILLAIEDVTAKKIAEKKLHESEQHYRWIVQQIKDYVIFTMDKNGLINDWNAAAEHITGFQKEEVMGKFHGLIYTPEDQKRNVPSKELQVAKRKGKAINERWHLKKNGDRFWGSGVVMPLIDEQGKICGFSKIMRDVTRVKTQEQNKEEFFRIASHELRTPLTSIKAYAQVLIRLLEDSKDKKNIYFLNKINNQTDKIITLIREFLAVSKIEAGKLVLTMHPFDLDALINKIVVDFQYTIETHQIEKKGQIKKIIIGDEDSIGQVIINLLTNAIKYSPDADRIIVSSKVGKNSVTVGVQDFDIFIRVLAVLGGRPSSD